MAVAAKQPQLEQPLSDMNSMMEGLEALVITDDRGGKHKKGCIDSQDSTNKKKGPPLNAVGLNRLKSCLRDRADQKKRDNIRVGAIQVFNQAPRPVMSRADIHPPPRPHILPPPWRGPPRPPSFPVRPIAPVHPEVEPIDNGGSLLALLHDADPPSLPPPLPQQPQVDKRTKQKMVNNIIMRQMFEERKLTLPAVPFAEETDFYSIPGAPPSCDSLQALSPQQSSSNPSPPAMFFLQQPEYVTPDYSPPDFLSS